MTPYRFRISNDRAPPPSAKVLVASFLQSSPPVYDGSRLLYLKAGADPLDNPRRVLNRMKVGDNVLFPASPAQFPVIRARLVSASKLLGRRFVTHGETSADHSGLRVWRII